MMDSLKIEHHIQHLRELHDKLDVEIRQREGNHQHGNMIIDLKKKKLKLKDQIEKFKKQIV
jgi:hypothetical protein